jgi:hypothetical protein
MHSVDCNANRRLRRDLERAVTCWRNIVTTSLNTRYKAECFPLAKYSIWNRGGRRKTSPSATSSFINPKRTSLGLN